MFLSLAAACGTHLLMLQGRHKLGSASRCESASVNYKITGVALYLPLSSQKSLRRFLALVFGTSELLSLYFTLHYTTMFKVT